jgi:tRNA G18 (ribose-2'-O)-methylase SpoU
MNNTYNVHDFLKPLEISDIKKYCKSNAIDAACAGLHILGDFNLGSMIRSANFFGFKEIVYIGGKKSFDRRSTVGTHNYTDVTHIKEESAFIEYVRKNNYTLISVENNIEQFNHKTVSLFSPNVFDTIKNPMFLFGEENLGISDKLLIESDLIITIPAYGSVRSLNVGCCSSTIFGVYRGFIESQKRLDFFV